MNRVFTYLLFFITISSGCIHEHKRPKYDLEYFLLPDKNIAENLKDSVRFFIHSIISEKNASIRKTYFKNITSIDVSNFVSVIEGDTTMLGVGDFIIPYTKSSYKLLAVGTFLKEKYNLKRDVFDQLLRTCLVLDSTNVEAMYILSELRYDGRFQEDAAYLIRLMSETDKNNKKIRKLSSFSKIENRKRDFKTFLNTDVLYND